MLMHKVRPVGAMLARHVENLWMARGSLPGRWRNMILPDGTIELIINLGDPQYLCARDERESATIFRQSWISGERTSPIVIDEAGSVHLIGARLRPGGAWPFLGMPLREFTDQVIELEAVLGREVVRLRERIGAAANDDVRFDLLEAWLVARSLHRSAPTRAVSHALAVIRRGEAVPITKIAADVGISHKHLLREFDRCVGLRPKVFARLSAFQRVIQRVGHRANVDWSDVAALCGYCDQAHLIREFRSFSGLTPMTYLRKRGPFLNYLALD